jgi:hypothetical protein
MRPEHKTPLLRSPRLNKNLRNPQKLTKNKQVIYLKTPLTQELITLPGSTNLNDRKTSKLILLVCIAVLYVVTSTNNSGTDVGHDCLVELLENCNTGNTQAHSHFLWNRILKD